MFNWIIKKIVGSKNQRELRRMQPIVRRINEIEQGLAGLSDDELRAKTRAWQEELKGIQDLTAVKARLDEILPEAFALVKHAARRLTERKHQFTVCDQPVTWAMIHFDVQLIGGMVLHSGRISEMATGEGKTLVATAPMYLNALAGRGAHLVTVNDYLSRRDAEWMGQLYGFLGLTTGIIQHDQPPEIRRAQYEADITYGTNAEFGFDYLRDNGMATSRDQQVQRGYFFAIVDEVDSILIDEARTPLIISGPSTVSTHQYDRFKPLVEQLVRKQNLLCNRLATDAKELYDAGKRDEAGRAMFKLKLGQPRSKALARMMEDTDMRRLIDKAELEFYKDTEGKAALVALKEELYFTIEERQHDADLTQLGRDFLNPDDPDAFVLPDLLTEFADIDNDAKLSGPEKVQKKAQRQQYCDNQAERIHNISQLLKAYCLYERDVEYVVEENKVVIVDTYTGRKMPGRRWSDGLHQAVEAKEGVQIDRETQTLATITIQNYFRLYARLSGMTGTAETEANEFHDIYGLDVNVIPTNRPVKRIDENDRIYKTRREKYNAVIDAIKGAHAKGQPVLVGTASVESSELLGRMLKREKIPHTVLNAKYHMQEAEIVSRAGLKGAVTISTNMAGRGTDIKLGEGVNEAGGLYVIGTERHESRRIDRQLRGRCARQGDPGMSRFYVSFEDDLMRNFGAADRMTKIMETFGLKEGEELEHPWLNKSVETAQKRVEQRNYMIRRRTLEFDDVMNQQREVVYGYRQEVMDSETPRDLIFEVISEIVPKKVADFLGDTEGEEPDNVGLLNWVNTTFPLGLSAEKAALESRSVEENGQWLVGVIKDAYEKKASMEHPEALKGLERYIILNAVDRLWQEHLYAMDGLREAVYLRAFAQKDPLVEYKNEAFAMFSELMDNIKGEVLTNLFRSTTNLQAFEMLLRSLPQNLLQADVPGLTDPAEPRPPQQAAAPAPAQAAPAPPQHIELAIKRELPKAGRNDPCPCGSGKKYKNCCGRTA
ncbi:preprotein translocase subunit SecA [Terrimicrobium sacchariphilum]|uniref:Protein translocase subunit SecA n=1 Tax=Terrimicrobium sacchariphilum TaxID=690879 RepID=A0A146GA09_TERSA|nr:preprotein translocase subunit SecA [Terrimicrobium sacchariphilum]GAT34271.1 preprotein translocase subunit SecA [Terrimicrobium sacchariphilum]